MVPGGNDIDAVVAHLFATHNRMHDWSYFLGWTERNYNMQLDNFGLTDPTVANDPEIGNAQAGAITGAPRTMASTKLIRISAWRPPLSTAE